MNIKDQVNELMLNNRRWAGTHQYTVPSSQTYPYQWLWDSCFHAIILTHLNVSDAKKELLSLVSKQFKNGLLPHMIYWEKIDKTDFPVIEWGKKDTSTITQPPLIAYAAWRIYEVDQDKAFLKKIYKNLKAYYHYLLSERNPEKSYLLGIVNPDESGEDNSPRFDKLLGLPPVHSLDVNFSKRLEIISRHAAGQSPFWIKDVPFNVICIKALQNLSKIATTLTLFEEAQVFETQAQMITNAMRKLMWEDGIFWSVYDKGFKKIKVTSWAIFVPMFARLYTFKEAESLVKNYLLKKGRFDRPFLLPTISKDDPSYDPSGPWRGMAEMLSTHLSWRGPVWMAVNWFVYKGLINYGFFDLAKEIKKSSLKLIAKSGFREHYNPETGQGLGAKNFTWGGLVLDM